MLSDCSQFHFVCKWTEYNYLFFSISPNDKNELPFSLWYSGSSLIKSAVSKRTCSIVIHYFVCNKKRSIERSTKYWLKNPLYSLSFRTKGLGRISLTCNTAIACSQNCKMQIQCSLIWFSELGNHEIRHVLWGTFIYICIWVKGK